MLARCLSAVIIATATPLQAQQSNGVERNQGVDISAAAAMQGFVEICQKSFPDESAIKAAAALPPWRMRYVRSRSVHDDRQPDMQEWSGGNAELTFFLGDKPRICSFHAVVAAQKESEIEQLLNQAFAGKGPSSRTKQGGLRWEEQAAFGTIELIALMVPLTDQYSRLILVMGDKKMPSSK